MKRARSEKPPANTNPSILDVLFNDTLYLITSHLEEARDLLHFAVTCRALYHLCRVNNLWAAQLHRALAFPTFTPLTGRSTTPDEATMALATPRAVYLSTSVGLFLNWLVSRFNTELLMSDFYLASVDGAADAQGRVYTFSYAPPPTDENDPVKRDVSLQIGPSLASSVQTDVASNKLIEKIRDVIYDPLRCLTQTAKGLGMACWCKTCKLHAIPSEKKRGGFKLVSPFDAPLEAGLLWYTVYKICAIDAWLHQSFVTQQVTGKNLWGSVLEAFAREISLSALSHPEARCSPEVKEETRPFVSQLMPVTKQPCAWYRPSAQSVAAAEVLAIGSTRNCSHCTLPMPSRSSQLIVAQAIAGANPFGLSGANVYCSTGCMMAEVFSRNQAHLSCANPHCTGKIALRDAVNLELSETQSSPTNTYSERIIVMIKDGVEITKTISLDIFDPEVKQLIHQTDHNITTALDATKRKLIACSRTGGKSDSSVVDTEKFAALVFMAENIAAWPIFLLYGISDGGPEVWERRGAIHESCRAFLQDETMPPWRFLGLRLPFTRAMYPTNEIRQCASAQPKNKVDSFSVYCTLGCAKTNTKNGADHRCLNSACGMPFHICTAAVTFECFEVMFYPSDDKKPAKSRGYVCDRHCFEAYIEERQRHIQGELEYRRRMQMDISKT